MAKPTDIRVTGTALYLLPVRMRLPLKFGPETVTEVTCARVRVRVADTQGRTAEGWGETPLSVQWVWPSQLPYQQRLEKLTRFCVRLAEAWAGFDGRGHPLEIGHDFQKQVLPPLLGKLNQQGAALAEPMPWLAALVCCSPFDIAVHDAFGQMQQRDVYETYGPEFLNRDLADFLSPATDSAVFFEGRFPSDFLVVPRPNQLPAWHLVGGLDLLHPS